jgi:hypothetical protein
MGYGLGKDTPIVLSLGKSNFEALVDRHGQWLRWRIAKKCTCVTSSNYADPKCTKCGGSGETYDFQREYEDIFRTAIRANVIIIPEVYSDAEILQVYDAYGKHFQFCRCDDFIQIQGTKVPDNELVDVRFRAPLVKTLDTAVLENIGGGYYRVPGILTEPSKLEGVYYQAAGDVISIEELKDDEGNAVKVLGYRRDMVNAASQAKTLTANAIKYVMPFMFVLLSQNLSKEDQALVNAHNGDAVCTFPNMFNLSEGDVITVLAGSMTHKILVKRDKNNSDDIIPDFFVAKVDSIETKTATYKEGTDFILTGTNRIHWIGNRPVADDPMSLTYRYHPTYRADKNIPMLRTSENQRLPHKVVMKLFSAFSEAKKVNQNA